MFSGVISEYGRFGGRVNRTQGKACGIGERLADVAQGVNGTGFQDGAESGEAGGRVVQRARPGDQVAS